METRQQSKSEMMIPVLELLTIHFVSELNILNIIIYVQCTNALETRQEKSFEVIIPVLEHDKLHFGSGRVSVLTIMIKIAFSPGASLGP